MSAYMAPAKASDWRTPENVILRLRSFAPIALDPCAAPDPAHRFAASNYTGDPYDGLRESWAACRGLVYANPPYGPALPAWTSKAAKEATLGAEVILLVPARTDTRWWHENIARAAAVCFWRGRLRFVGAASSAPFPSALAYYGARAEQFRRAFVPCGWVVGARGLFEEE